MLAEEVVVVEVVVLVSVVVSLGSSELVLGASFPGATSTAAVTFSSFATIVVVVVEKEVDLVVAEAMVDLDSIEVITIIVVQVIVATANKKV